MKKYLLFIFLSLILILPTRVYADNLTEQVDSKSTKVYDYADLLTDEEETNLRKLANDFIEKYQMDMVLVTINENPYGISDYYTQQYAQDFYYYNGFGVGNKSSGIIFLIDMANRYPYIATKGEAILTFDDKRIEQMHDSAYDNLAAGSYYEAFRSFVTSASDFASDGIPNSNKLYCIDDNGNYYKCKKEPKSVNWLITILAAVLGSLIPVLIHLRKYKGIRIATNANVYLKSSTQDNKVDQFLTTFTSQVRRSQSSSSGGHSGGGSSISHGSGGSFGGGGGRHF